MGKDAVLILAMRIFGTLLWMVYTIVLARSLNQPDFVIVLYVINFSFIAVLIVTLGCDVGLLKFASQCFARGNHRAIRNVMIRTRWMLLGTSGLLTVGLEAAVWAGIKTPVTEHWDIALIAGLLTGVGAQMGVNRDCLRALGKVWQSQLGLNLTRSVIPIVGSTIAIFSTGLSVQVALLLFFASMLLSVAVEEMFLRQIDWSKGTADAESEFSEFAKTAMVIWPGDIANAIQVRAAGLIAGLVLPPEGAALFLAAERIAGLAQFPIAAAGQAAAPKIARVAAVAQAEAQRTLSQGSLLIAAGALCGVVGAAIMAYPGLFALGDKYLPALPILLILLVSHASWAFFGLAQTSLNLTGHQKEYSLISIFWCAFGVAAIWFGLVQFGALGGATAFCLTWWLTNISYTVAVHVQTGLRTGVSAVDAETLRRAFHAVRVIVTFKKKPKVPQ